MHSVAPSGSVAIPFLSCRLLNLPSATAGCQHDRLAPAKLVALACAAAWQLRRHSCGRLSRWSLLEVLCNLSFWPPLLLAEEPDSPVGCRVFPGAALRRQIDCRVCIPSRNAWARILLIPQGIRGRPRSLLRRELSSKAPAARRGTFCGPAAGGAHPPGGSEPRTCSPPPFALRIFVPKPSRLDRLTTKFRSAPKPLDLRLVLFYALPRRTLGL
jgi:hypothetical protein